MNRAARQSLLAASLLGASVLVALTVSLPLGLSDYHLDAGPAVNALSHLDLPGYLRSQALMGSFSVLLRAPFVALAGTGDQTEAYRLGLVPCVFAVALLALALARRMAAEGRSLLIGFGVLAILVAHPLMHEAIVFGHPEELLAGALCVAAILACSREAPVLGGVALGLALATKQWAVVAAAIAVAACPSRRGVVVIWAGAVAGALTLPAILFDGGGFVATQARAANVDSWVSMSNVWWPLANAMHRTAFDGVGPHEFVRYTLPSALNPVPHPLIVGLGIALGALMLRARRPFCVSEALAALAFVLLLRCALDPWNAPYYSVPLLIALCAHDATARRGLPLLSTFGALGLWLTLLKVPSLGDPLLWNAAYLSFAVALGAFLLTKLGGLGIVLGQPGPASLAPRAAHLPLLSAET
ncbi:MAG TPA: glycosyltransferase 87 family protein [Solirubrobacteraceae bacterium]|nr:glycosyltransferase 87 family protein [Solirubrobacteraceae bacterium]